MNKREKFWISKLIGFTIIILCFTLLSLYNIILFNNSYMKEEKAELSVFQRQIEWAIKPYLKNKDFTTLKKYCEDFEDEDIKFRLFDNNKNLIASSDKSNTGNIIKDDIQRITNINKIWDIHKIHNKEHIIGLVKTINLENGSYYLELTISEEDVMKSILHAQFSIWIFLIICLTFLILGFIYVFNRLKRPFDQLQNSVTEIANGKLDTKIEIPEIAILQDLAESIKKMTKQLKSQIIRLKQLEEYKTNFIQDISHEIKTPITAINTAVELIKDNNTITSEQDKECFNIISYQVDAINNLVNDILQLAEIESEKHGNNKEFKKFNLNETVNKIINYMPQNIPINFHAQDENIILGDQKLIEQAISNLIINAIKYSRSPQIDIELSVDKENNTIIQVKDYGIGIEEKHHDKIFDRFYRIDKTRSRATGGSGLGLAIVKNIVELHNGTITLHSRINKGCNFIISIPNSFE